MATPILIENKEGEWYCILENEKDVYAYGPFETNKIGMNFIKDTIGRSELTISVGFNVFKNLSKNDKKLYGRAISVCILKNKCYKENNILN